MKDFPTTPGSFQELKTILTSADGFAVFVDNDLCIRYCTPRATQLLELNDADYEQPLAKHKAKFGYEDLLTDAKRVLASSEAIQREVKILKKQQYYIRLLPCLMPEGEATGLMVTMHRATIELANGTSQLETETALKEKAEAALRKSRQAAKNRLREINFIYDTAPVGLCVLDTEFRYLRINERLAETNGLSVDDHLGKTLREIVPDLADEAEAALQKIIDSGEPILGLEIRGETPAQPGVERIWLENWLPFKDVAGKVVGVNIVAEEVTEQRKIEAAREETQARYQRLFNAIEDGFCVCQMLVDERNKPYDYRFVEVNRSFEAHTGLKDAQGKTAYNLMPNLEQHWLETYSKVALELEPIRFEQGSTEMGRWFDVYAFPFGLPEEKKFAIQFKDITQRKQAEEALQKAKEEAERQERKLHNLFEQAPVAIAILSGPQFVVELANPKINGLWDRTPAELLGNPIFEVLTEARDQGLEDLLAGVLQSGKPYVGNELPVTLHRRGKLETAYFNLVYHPWQNESGQTDRVIVVATEVTEQVLARQAVEASEERFKTLLNSIPQMTWTNLPDGQVNFYNDRWFDFTGLTYEQMQGWGWKPIVHPDDLDDMLATYLGALKKGWEFVYESRLKQQDGTYRWHLNRSLPLRDESGQITLWVGTSTDIHEQKLAEEKLQQTSEELEVVNEELLATNDELINYNEDLSQANEQLTRVNTDLDNFVYMASHDLKTPINNIEGLINTLERSLPSESTQAGIVPRLLEMMHTSVARFKSTLTELAQITRLRREAAEDIEQVSLPEILEEVQQDLAMMIEEADAQLEIDIALCPSVKFSAKNLRSIVYNLLSNAIKYRSPDRQLQVRIRCKVIAQYHILSVADNGLGMDMTNEEKIFAMFQRLHDHVEGTGVGLYITKRIIENAGGKIEVNSEVDVGTTFKVYFKQ